MMGLAESELGIASNRSGYDRRVRDSSDKAKEEGTSKQREMVKPVEAVNSQVTEHELAQMFKQDLVVKAVIANTDSIAGGEETVEEAAGVGLDDDPAEAPSKDRR